MDVFFIAAISKEQTKQPYVIQRFVDPHVHIESSMLVPDEYAQAALRHGTFASVSDPYEIANVLDADCINFMLVRADLKLFRIIIGAPNCVPAMPIESSRANIDPATIRDRLKKESGVPFGNDEFCRCIKPCPRSNSKSLTRLWPRS